MKNSIIYSVIPAIALAFAVPNPASAQLLGGSGSGGLTGGIGGSIERTTGTAAGSTTGSLRGEKQIDRKSGRVRGSGDAQGSSNGSITGGTTAADRNINGMSNGSANASKSGSVDAQLVGADFVRGTGQDALARGRSAADTMRGTAGSAANSARSAASSAAGSPSGAGSITGSGMAQGMSGGGMGQLVSSGSFAASKSGSFAIEPGMPIEDAKGRTIGYVQSVKQTKQGVIEAVTVETGSRMATLPAANFSGQGDALVTGMSKGQLTSAAKNQEAQGAGQPAPAMMQSAPEDSAGQSASSPSGVRARESNTVKDR